LLKLFLWIPAFAGMTDKSDCRKPDHDDTVMGTPKLHYKFL